MTGKERGQPCPHVFFHGPDFRPALVSVPNGTFSTSFALEATKKGLMPGHQKGLLVQVTDHRFGSGMDLKLFVDPSQVGADRFGADV